MTIDPTTGIDFGNVKYTLMPAKGISKDGKQIDGYSIKLENGVSLFVAKNNIQKGAKITVNKNGNGPYENNVVFTGFKNVSIFGSEKRDDITVDNGTGIHVRTDNDGNTGDNVHFTNRVNQNNSWIGGKYDLMQHHFQSTITTESGVVLDYKESKDVRMGGTPEDNTGRNIVGVKKFAVPYLTQSSLKKEN